MTSTMATPAVVKDPRVLREALAAYAHAAWSHWMQHLFSMSTENPDGTVTIPKASVERWKFQMNTSYARLPEPMRESDRKQANQILRILSK